MHRSRLVGGGAACLIAWLFTASAGIGGDSKLKEPTAAQRRIAQAIAGGHAYEKHVVTEKQFPEVKNESDFGALIGKILANPTHHRKLESAREAYFDSKSNTIVIYNPRAKDNGTCFRPRGA